MLLHCNETVNEMTMSIVVNLIIVMIVTIKVGGAEVHISGASYKRRFV